MTVLWQVVQGGLIVTGAWVLLSMAVGRVRLRLARGQVALGDPAIVDAVGRMSRTPERCAVAVVDGEGAVRTACLGCGPHTGFEVGSVSKALTGLLVADAVERGELRLSDTLGEHLPELAGSPAGSVTLLEACQHTSGLPRLASGPSMLLGGLGFAVLGLNPYALASPRRVLRQARRARLGKPGYSNLGGGLVGLCLERCTDRAYGDLLDERLLVPVGMQDGAVQRDRGRRGDGRWAARWDLRAYEAAGGVVSTLADLTRLAERLLDGTAPGVSALRDTDPALFWVRDVTPSGRRIVLHNGQTGGYSALVVLVPDEHRAVVILSSLADAEALPAVARDLLPAQD